MSIPHISHTHLYLSKLSEYVSQSGRRLYRLPCSMAPWLHSNSNEVDRINSVGLGGYSQVLSMHTWRAVSLIPRLHAWE